MIRCGVAMNEVRKFVLEVHTDDNGYWAEVVDLPGCFASGADLPELFEAIGEAIGLYLTSDSQSVKVQHVDVGLQQKVQKVPISATLAPAM